MGVEVNSILVVFPDDIVGKTEPKNSSQFSTQAVSSTYRNEQDFPLIALDDVLDAMILHPFSNSTRRRKIERHEYPAPVKLSSQMCVWRSSEIRTWRQDPTAYRTTEHEPTYKNGLLGDAVVLKGAKS